MAVTAAVLWRNGLDLAVSWPRRYWVRNPVPQATSIVRAGDKDESASVNPASSAAPSAVFGHAVASYSRAEVVVALLPFVEVVHGRHLISLSAASPAQSRDSTHFLNFWTPADGARTLARASEHRILHNNAVLSNAHWRPLGSDDRTG
jgi:hypothetical protein